MDEGRLKAVKKGQKLHRKFAYAMNDTIRNRQEYYRNCLSREEQEAHTRLVSKVMDIRRSVVRNKVLLQCLSLQKQSQPARALTEPLLGSYGGRPIASFSRDIDQRLAWFHPRLRRLRKVDRVRQNCLKHGAILDEDTIKDRMQDFFSKNLALDTPALDQSRKHNSQHAQNKDNKNKKIDNATNKNNNDDDDDDDDFDIRDYHNPIAGANFKLRLHPFGNMVDFHNKGESKKFNLLTRRNVFTASKPEHPPGAPPTGEKSQQVSRTESVPHPHRATGDAAVTSSLPPATRESPPRLSKYPEPLPPITSGGGRKQPRTSESRDAESEGIKSGGYRDRDGIAEANSTLLNGLEVARTSNEFEARAQSLDQSSDPAQSEIVKVKTKSEEDMPKLTRRKTLILPPLETSKEMVHSKN